MCIFLKIRWIGFLLLLLKIKALTSYIVEMSELEFLLLPPMFPITYYFSILFGKWMNESFRLNVNCKLYYTTIIHIVFVVNGSAIRLFSIVVKRYNSMNCKAKNVCSMHPGHSSCTIVLFIVYYLSVSLLFLKKTRNAKIIHDFNVQSRLILLYPDRLLLFLNCQTNKRTHNFR